ncbi:MAG: histidine kinase [Eubacteriales bacterium]|nr:histidine kinase [Eubacteriales bacterium]
MRTFLEETKLSRVLAVLFVFLVIFPFLILSTVTSVITEKYAKESYGNYMTQVLDSVSNQIDSVCGTYADSAINFYYNGIVEILENGEQDAEEESRIVRKMSEMRDLLGDNYVTAIYLITEGQSYLVGKNYDDFDRIVERYASLVADKNGRHVWSDVVTLIPKNRSGQKVVFAKSLNGVEEKNIAQVYMVIDLEEFLNCFLNEKTGSAIPFLLNNRGELLYYGGTEGDPAYEEIAAPDTQDQVTEMSVSHQTYLNITKESKKTGWTAGYVVPMRAVLSEFQAIKIVQIVMTVIMCLFLLLILLLIERYVVGPIRFLTDRMDAFAAGGAEETVYIPAIGELSRLNRHFNGMSSRITELIQKNTQKEKEKNEFKMEALRAQLSPHFIYNSLNTIKWMAVINRQDNIRDLTEALISLLMSSAKGREARYTLGDEIRLIQSYAVIQKARFLNFDIQFCISPEAACCEIVQFLLQPVVENAIVHGFERGKYRRGVVKVNACCAEGRLRITVADNGVGFDVEQWQRGEHGKSEVHTNIALDHISQIIALEYGENYGMEIQSSPGEGTTVVYVLPERGKTGIDDTGSDCG